jgi:hypothetical protein
MMRRLPNASCRAFSLVEVGITLGLFTLFLLVFYAMLQGSQSLWSRNSSSQDALLQLQKVRGALEADLRETRISRLKVRDGRDDVVWFLSAHDPTTGEFLTDDDGSPYWSYNILYYMAVPTDHDQLFGVTCAGTDNRCPHKFLIRRVIRRSPWADSDLEPVPLEQAIFQNKIDEFIDLPTGYALGFPTPGGDPPCVVKSELVATGLVAFQVQKAAESPWDNEIQVKVGAFQLDKAGQKIRLGQDDLTESPFTEWMVFSVFPDH